MSAENVEPRSSTALGYADPQLARRANWPAIVGLSGALAFWIFYLVWVFQLAFLNGALDEHRALWAWLALWPISVSCGVVFGVIGVRRARKRDGVGLTLARWSILIGIINLAAVVLWVVLAWAARPS